MSAAVKRILLVTRKVQFAIDIKRALEALGEYQVTPVTEARNAIDELRRKRHHLVLLDTDDLGMQPSIMLDLIRARQSDIAIVLSPDDEPSRDLALRHQAGAVIDLPASARSLLPVMEAAMRQLYDALPQTLRLPAVDLPEDTVQIETLVDESLPDQAPPSYSLQRLQASYRLFRADEKRAADAALQAVELVIESSPDGETMRFRHADGTVPATETLSAATDRDEDTPISEREPETTVRELSQALTTHAADFTALETDSAGFAAVDASSLSQKLEFALDSSGALDELESETLTPLHSRDGAKHINQLATAMTQMSAELTAEATLLTRDDMPVAFAGQLPIESLLSLRQAIGDDWSADAGKARLRFLTLPGDGSQFMLWSKATVDGLTLNLIFAGSKSLTAIHHQAQRMLSALADLPDAPGDADQPPQLPPPSATQPLAFVWLLAERAPKLSETVALQLVFWLEMALNAEGWRIRRLDAHADFVVLSAHAPTQITPESATRDLLSRSRDIARAADASLPEALWADAYLVLQPGRDLSNAELRAFLAFARDDAAQV